ERDPKDRYATAADLGRDVQGWLEHERVTAYQENLLELALRFARRRPATAAAAVLSTVVIAVTLSVAFRVVEQNRVKARVRSQAEALEPVAPEAVPAILALFGEYREWVEPHLHDRLMGLPKDRQRRVRLALLPWDPSQEIPLREDLLDISNPRE